MRFLVADIGTSSVKTAQIVCNKGDGRDTCPAIKNNFLGDDFLISSLESTPVTFDGFEALQWRAIISDSINRSPHLDAICISGNGPTLVSDSGRTLLWNIRPPLVTANASSKNNTSPSSPYRYEVRRYEVPLSMFLPRFNLFKSLYPADYKNSKYLLGSAEWVIKCLTGNSSMVLPEPRFSRYYWGAKDYKHDANRKHLPPFVAPGVIAGQFCGVPVIYGTPDFIASIIGCNTLSPGNLCDRAGSSEGINLCVSREIHSPQVRTMPSVIKGLWYISVVINNSGTRLAPFISNNCDFLDDKNSGGYKVFNSLMDNVKDALDTLRHLAATHGEPFDNKIVTCGGQAQNKKFIKEKSRLLGIPIIAPRCVYAELLGDAIIAKAALSKHHLY